MLRRMFTAASVLSMFLCLATAAGWLRSYWRCDDIQWTRHYRKVNIISQGGELAFAQAGVPSIPFWESYDQKLWMVTVQ